MSKKAIQISGEIATETTKAIITSGAGLILAAFFPETIPYWVTTLCIPSKVGFSVFCEKIKDKFNVKEGYFASVNEIYNKKVEDVLKKGTIGDECFVSEYEHFRRYYFLCNEHENEISENNCDENGVVNYLSPQTIKEILKLDTKNTNQDTVIKVADEILKNVITEITDNTDLAPTYFAIQQCKSSDDFKKILTEIQTGINDIIDTAEKNKNDIIDTIKYKNSFVEYIDNFKLPRKHSTKHTRFHYLNEKIKFYGRSTELNQIKSFLTDSDNMKIWVICGQGGVGKSKFARHICDTLSNEYKFVWLSDSDLKTIPEIAGEFEYNKTIVFICDYADEKIDNLYITMQKMYNSELKTRFILLTRNSSWYNDTAKNENYPIIKEKSYNYDSQKRCFIPLDLSNNPLEDKDYKDIIEDFQNAFYPDKTLNKKETEIIISIGKKIIPSNSINHRASRCLFFLMIADAYIQNGTSYFDSENLDYTEVISGFFSRTKSHLTNKYDKYIVNAGFRVLAISTAIKGLNFREDNLPEFLKKDIDKIKDHFESIGEINEFFSNLSDTEYNDNSGIIIKPYEPDILGEYLFLSEWNDCIDKNLWCEYLYNQMSSNNAIILFTSRCLADWNTLSLDFTIKLKAFEEK